MLSEVRQRSLLRFDGSEDVLTNLVGKMDSTRG